MLGSHYSKAYECGRYEKKKHCEGIYCSPEHAVFKNIPDDLDLEYDQGINILSGDVTDLVSEFRETLLLLASIVKPL